MSLFYPDFRKNRITEVTPEFLKIHGFKGIILDVDNTLSKHHAGILGEGVSEWIKEMEKNGVLLIIASNSKDFRIRPFAEKAGLPYISLCCKPLPFKMKKAARKMGLKKSECLMAGDQIFTDVLGARLAGIKVLLTEPIEEETGLSFKIRRKLEKKIKNRHNR